MLMRIAHSILNEATHNGTVYIFCYIFRYFLHSDFPLLYYIWEKLQTIFLVSADMSHYLSQGLNCLQTSNLNGVKPVSCLLVGGHEPQIQKTYSGTIYAFFCYTFQIKMDTVYIYLFGFYHALPTCVYTTTADGCWHSYQYYQ